MCFVCVSRTRKPHRDILVKHEGVIVKLKSLNKRFHETWADYIEVFHQIQTAGLNDAEGAQHRMLSLLRLETSFAKPRRHLGYRSLTMLGGLPWHGTLRGHEFHFASTVKAEGDPLFLAHDAEGADLGETGLRAGRVMGSFAHVIEVG